MVDIVPPTNFHCYFISPHLDDAIFSAGSLIQKLASTHSVTVITVFTKSLSTPPTLSARRYLQLVSTNDPISLYKKRVAEDHVILDQLGVACRYLGFVDALWRQHPKPSIGAKILGHILPEMKALYPTYRWHIASGKIAFTDQTLIHRITHQLKKVITSPSIVFTPLAIGQHVDHLIVREACRHMQIPLIYWADYPYHQHFPVDHAYIASHQLQQVMSPINATQKVTLIKGYQTQLAAIFPRGIGPLPPEYFYLSPEYL